MTKNSMKNLFSRSLRNKQTVMMVLSIALVIAFVASNLFESTNTTVVNGDYQEVTAQNNIAGIKTSDNDKIQTSVNTNFKNNNTNSYEQALNLTIQNGGNNKMAGTTSTTVADFLKQPIVESGEIGRAQQKTKALAKTPNTTAFDVRVQKVTDVVEGSKGSTTDVSNNKITKVSKAKTYKTKGRLNLRKSAGTKYKVLLTIPKGKKVTYKGKKGSWYKVKYKGKTGYVSSKYLTSTKKVSKPKTPSRSGEPSRGQTMYVTATAYTAFCNGCSGKTATGIDLRKNPNIKLIAVDPKVIKLGSKVWVEDYGYAVAGDTGGAIKGSKIDVFISNKQAVYNWGRKRVKIKVLN
ncbi:3D domain-containing protein [Viridibacillus sp. NPDC096237]|uniref:3D domain-containing protein n=1 Tax=Viridibacillus sp. NPDC096237 TaxID=3390721 RepID=UPI003CFF5864